MLPVSILGAQPALLQSFLHGVGIEGLDAERDVIDADVPRRRRFPFPLLGRRLAEIRIVGIAAADEGVSDVAHQHLVLAAFVVGALPAEQVGVDRTRSPCS